MRKLINISLNIFFIIHFTTFFFIRDSRYYSLRRIRVPLAGYIERRTVYEGIWQKLEGKIAQGEGYSADELSRQLRISSENLRYGISEVIWVPQETEIYQKILKIQERLVAEFQDKVKLVPASLLHMTILELITGQDTQIVPEVVREIKRSTGSLAIPKGTKVYIEGLNFDPNIGIFVQGYEQDNRITQRRQMLRQKFPTASKQTEEPAFHITMAYITGELSPQEAKRIAEMISPLREEIFGWLDVSKANMEAFYYYNSLFTHSERDKEVRYDTLGTTTYYEQHEGNFRKTQVVDRYGKTIERYQYKQDKIEKVLINNIKTGEEIEIRPQETMHASGEFSQVIHAFVNGEDTGSMLVRFENKIARILGIELKIQKQGIGISLFNWAARYASDRFGIHQVSINRTNNPVVINQLRKITVPGTRNVIVYRHQESNDFLSLGDATFKQLLEKIEKFKVGRIGSPDEWIFYTGSVDPYFTNLAGEWVEVRNGKVVYSDYIWLSVGDPLERVDVTDDGIVTFNGNQIGELKQIGDEDNEVIVRGEINPIGVFTDARGSIIEYQNNKIVRIIVKSGKVFSASEEIRKYLRER